MDAATLKRNGWNSQKIVQARIRSSCWSVIAGGKRTILCEPLLKTCPSPEPTHSACHRFPLHLQHSHAKPSGEKLETKCHPIIMRDFSDQHWIFNNMLSCIISLLVLGPGFTGKSLYVHLNTSRSGRPTCAYPLNLASLWSSGMGPMVTCSYLVDVQGNN